MNKPHVLVGKTLIDIQLAADKEAIRFVTTDGDVVALCDADCCSHTWVETVESTLRRFPATILKAGDLELNREPEDDPELEVVQFYGFELVTDQGVVIFDYRNSSNGYYGGWLVWEGEHHYGGVYAQNVSDQVWQAIEGLTA